MSEKRSQPQDEFEEQLSSVRTQLYSYIYSLICNINDADDVYQLTTIVLWKKFDQFDRSRAFNSWAFGIARFEVSNFLKKRSRQRLYFSDELTLQLLLAASMLLVVGGFLIFSRANSDQVAWLSNAQNCEWENDTRDFGNMKADTRLRLQSGLAEIDFASGANPPKQLGGSPALTIRSRHGFSLIAFGNTISDAESCGPRMISASKGPSRRIQSCLTGWRTSLCLVAGR